MSDDDATRRMQAQRDAWRALALEVIEYLRDLKDRGHVGKIPDFDSRAARIDATRRGGQP